MISMSESPQAQGGQLDRSERKIISLMTASHGIQHFYVSGIALTYPYVIKEFHASYASLGVILGVSGVIGGLLQSAAGLVKGRQARSILALQDVGLALASFFGAISPGFAAYAGAKVFGSLAQWPQHPVGSAYLSEKFPSRRGTVLAWHTTGGSIGTLLVPLAMSVAITAYGWRVALGLLGLTLLVGAAIVQFFLPPQQKPKVVSSKKIGRPSLSSMLTSVRNIGVVIGETTSETKRILIASTVAAGGRGLGVIGAFIPLYLEDSRHLSQIETGIIYTTMLLGGVIGPLYAGNLSDRIGRKTVIMASYFLGAASFMGFALTGPNKVLLGIWGFAVGVLAYSESPLLQSMFADSVHNKEGNSAFGAYFSIAYGVGAIWLSILGWVIADFGFKAFFSAMAISFLVAGGIIATLPRPAKLSA